MRFGGRQPDRSRDQRVQAENGICGFGDSLIGRIWRTLGPEKTFGSSVGKKCRSEAKSTKEITLKAKISEPITKSESKPMTLFRVEEPLILRSLETKSEMDKTIRTGQK